ncbi:MAG: chemotaxis protein CheD, partial [Candidatus Nitrosocaldus sp.]
SRNHTVIHVKIGELAVSRDLPLTTIVGSCIACCIYDDRNKVGGMAHIMLPTNRINRSNDIHTNTKAKYADTAIKNLVDSLIKNGADINNLKAKIVGGARVFAHESDEDMFNIGGRNAEKVREMLKEYRIRIIAEDIGGRGGRNVTFDPSNLTIKVKGNGYEKIL